MHQLPPISQLEKSVSFKRTSNDDSLFQPIKKFRAELGVLNGKEKDLKTKFFNSTDRIENLVPRLAEDQPLEERIDVKSTVLGLIKIDNDKWLHEDQPLEERISVENAVQEFIKDENDEWLSEDQPLRESISIENMVSGLTEVDNDKCLPEDQPLEKISCIESTIPEFIKVDNIEWLPEDQSLEERIIVESTVSGLTEVYNDKCLPEDQPLEERICVENTISEFIKDDNDDWLPEDQPLEENDSLMTYTIDDLNVEYELLKDDMFTLKSNRINDLHIINSFETNKQLKMEPIHDDNVNFGGIFENTKDYEASVKEIISSSVFMHINEQTAFPTIHATEEIEKIKENPSINCSNILNNFVGNKKQNVSLTESISLNDCIKGKKSDSNSNSASRKVISRCAKSKSKISKRGKLEQKKILANCEKLNKKKKLKSCKKNCSSTSVQENGKYAYNSKNKISIISNSKPTVIKLKIKISKSSDIKQKNKKQYEVKELIANCDTSDRKKNKAYRVKNRGLKSIPKNSEDSETSKEKYVNNFNLKVSKKRNSKSLQKTLEINKQRKVKNSKKLIVINDILNRKENLTGYQKKISKFVSSLGKNNKLSKKLNPIELSENISSSRLQTSSSANLLAEIDNTIRETSDSNRDIESIERLKHIEIRNMLSSSHCLNNHSNQDNSKKCLTSIDTQQNKEICEKTNLIPNSNISKEKDRNISSIHIQTYSSANNLFKLQNNNINSNKQLINDEQLINTQANKSSSTVTDIMVQKLTGKQSIPKTLCQNEEIKINILWNKTNLAFNCNNPEYNKPPTDYELNDASCNNIVAHNDIDFCQNLKQGSLEKGKENSETKSKTGDDDNSGVLHILKNFVDLVNSTKRESKVALTSKVHIELPKLKIRNDIYQNFENNLTVDNSRSSSDIEILTEHHDPHISINYIKQCLDGWKKRYPWVMFHENKETMCCEICSVRLSRPFVVWKVKSSEDVFKIAASLLSHSTLTAHKILSCIQNSRAFETIYILLKTLIPTVTSVQQLYRGINEIMKRMRSVTISDQSIRLIICIIASSLRETLLNRLHSFSSSGIAFTCDPYRKILLARISNSQFSPEEYIITDFMDSSLSVDDYLLSKGFDNKNITFKKIFGNVACNFSRNDNSFPLRLPSTKELLSWLLINDSIRSYSMYVKCLSYLYNKYSADFNLIKDAYILSKASWENVHVYRLILKNAPQIKCILLYIYEKHVDKNAKYCISCVIDKGFLFYNIINIVSYLTWYVDAQQYSLDNEQEHRQKIYNFLISLERLDMKEHLYHTSLKILIIYCREILRDEYYIGKKNILACQFLFQPKRLVCLNTNQATFEELSLVQHLAMIFRHHLPPYEQFLESLSKFGCYLLQFVNKPCIPIKELCNMFITYPNLRLNYPYVQIFYTFLSTSPIFIAFPSVSPFCVSASLHYFNQNFGQDLSKDLLTIRYGATNSSIHIQQIRCDVYKNFYLTMLSKLQYNRVGQG